MARRRTIIVGAALAALIVVAYLWWPSLLEALQELHGPFGGGPGMHGFR